MKNIISFFIIISDKYLNQWVEILGHIWRSKRLGINRGKLVDQNKHPIQIEQLDLFLFAKRMGHYVGVPRIRILSVYIEGNTKNMNQTSTAWILSHVRLRVLLLLYHQLSIWAVWLEKDKKILTVKQWRFKEKLKKENRFLSVIEKDLHNLRSRLDHPRFAILRLII